MKPLFFPRLKWTIALCVGFLIPLVPIMHIEAQQRSGIAPILDLSVRNGNSWKVVPIKSIITETPLSTNCNCELGSSRLSLVAATDLGEGSPPLEITVDSQEQRAIGSCPTQIPVSAQFGPVRMRGTLEARIVKGSTEYNGILKEESPSPSTALSISKLAGTARDICPLELEDLTTVNQAPRPGNPNPSSVRLKDSPVSSPSAASGGSHGKSRFAKLAPILSNPIKVLISNDGGSFPGDGPYEKVGPIDQDHGFTLTSLDRKTTKVLPVKPLYFFPFNRDVEITIRTPLTITKEIAIYGGRSVVVKGVGGGYITKKLDQRRPGKCDQDDQKCRDVLAKYLPDVPRVLRFDSTRRSVFVKNLAIRVSGDFTDAIVFRQNPKTFDQRVSSDSDFENFGGIDIFVENVSAYEIGGAGTGQHGDIVQLQNGIYRNMFFENIDGSTGYQGFFLPQRLRGNPNLCSNVKDIDSSGNVVTLEKCLSPIVVNGTAFFENIVLRPIDPSLCPTCTIPYRGLYTKDPNDTTKSYETQLQNVTFFTDPRPDKRNKVPLYVMPEPLQSTSEGTINMTISTDGVIKGRLNIISTNYNQAKDALMKSGWRSSGEPGAKSPYRDAPEVFCGKAKGGACNAIFILGTKRLVLILEDLIEQDGKVALTVVGAHY